MTLYYSMYGSHSQRTLLAFMLNLLVRQVFKDLDFLGWYTVGSNAPSEDDVKIHQQVE